LALGRASASASAFAFPPHAVCGAGRETAARGMRRRAAMKILVTGASGFVGGAFVRRFAGRGDVEIHGIGRRRLDVPGYSAVDVSEPFGVPFAPDVVVHAAARASPWGTRAEFVSHNVDA